MSAVLPYRDGATYEHARDAQRLNDQQQRVWDAMKDGAWRTLAQIHAMTGDPEASISARLRDFRKPRFGSHGVPRRHVGDGLFEYRLVINHTSLFDAID